MSTYYPNQKTMYAGGIGTNLETYYVSGSNYGFTIFDPGETLDVNNYFVAWRDWITVSDFSSIDGQLIASGYGGSVLQSELGIREFLFTAYDTAPTVTGNLDFIIIRKSDRNAVRIQSTTYNIQRSNVILTSVKDVSVYLELLRLYNLGYI